MAEMENRCCGGCRFFTNECSTGVGICEAPLPYFMESFWSKEGLAVYCSDGSDCNTYRSQQSLEESDAVERKKVQEFVNEMWVRCTICDESLLAELSKKYFNLTPNTERQSK